MNAFEEIFKLMNLLSEVPDGTSREVESNGVKASLAKDKGFLSIQLEANHEEDFDETKELVKAYKENIKDLDDDIFVEVVDEMNEVLDIKEFDRLLALDKFTKEDAEKVEEMIDCSTNIISNKLQERITDLIDLYNKF